MIDIVNGERGQFNPSLVNLHLLFKCYVTYLVVFHILQIHALLFHFL